MDGNVSARGVSVARCSRPREGATPNGFVPRNDGLTAKATKQVLRCSGDLLHVAHLNQLLGIADSALQLSKSCKCFKG